MDVIFGLWLFAMLVGLYFLPTIIAVDRHVVNKWSVVVINVFLGWTLIGWVVALAMALRTATEKSGQVLAQIDPLSRDL